MDAIDHTIKHHYDKSQKDVGNHFTWQWITLELLREGIILSADHKVEEDEDVGDYDDLDEGDEDVEVFAWLLLRDQREELIEECVVVEDLPHSDIPWFNLLFFPVFSKHIILWLCILRQFDHIWWTFF